MDQLQKQNGNDVASHMDRPWSNKAKAAAITHHKLTTAIAIHWVLHKYKARSGTSNKPGTTVIRSSDSCTQVGTSCSQHMQSHISAQRRYTPAQQSRRNTSPMTRQSVDQHHLHRSGTGCQSSNAGARMTMAPSHEDDVNDPHGRHYTSEQCRQAICPLTNHRQPA